MLVNLPRTANGRQILAIKPKTAGELQRVANNTSFEDIKDSEWVVLVINKEWTEPSGLKSHDYVVWNMSGDGETFHGEYFEHREVGDYSHIGRALEAFNAR